jgi:hypothetical protein
LDYHAKNPIKKSGDFSKRISKIWLLENKNNNFSHFEKN